jgi:hypothetical protein
MRTLIEAFFATRLDATLREKQSCPSRLNSPADDRHR